MSGFLTGRTVLSSVDSGQINDDAVDSQHYAAGSIDTAHIAANQIDGTLTKDALIADYSDVTITAADLIMYGDATDSNNTKRDTVQGILDLASGGKIVQLVDANNATLTSSSVTYPDDNTIPQTSELTEIETVDITPTNTNNALLITGFYHGAITASNSYSICIYKDSDVNALAISTMSGSSASGWNWQVEYYTVGSIGTSSITYKMKIGRQSGGSGNTVSNTYNAGGAAKMGGIYRCRMQAIEITV